MHPEFHQKFNNNFLNGKMFHLSNSMRDFSSSNYVAIKSNHQNSLKVHMMASGSFKHQMFAQIQFVLKNFELLFI